MNELSLRERMLLESGLLPTKKEEKKDSDGEESKPAPERRIDTKQKIHILI